jgi:hypothetical protein
MADSPASYLDAWERTVSRVARTCSDPNTLRWIPLLLLADPVARAAAQPPTPLGQLSQPSTQPAPEALPGARARSENRALPSQSAVNTANNPLTDIPALQIQNYLQPVLTGRANAQANTPYIRFILPYTALGRRNLMRLSLPVASSTWSPTATALGLGDLTIFSIPIVEVDGARAGIGPLLVVPTATSPALGLKRWQVGGQGIFSKPYPWGLLAALVGYQQTLDGAGKQLVMQPFLFRQIGDGYYLRSSAIASVNFSDRSAVLPIGLGVGRARRMGNGNILNVYVEPQISVFTLGGLQPAFQVFAGFNLQFPPRP